GGLQRDIACRGREASMHLGVCFEQAAGQQAGHECIYQIGLDLVEGNAQGQLRRKATVQLDSRFVGAQLQAFDGESVGEGQLGGGEEFDVLVAVVGVERG